MPGQRRIDIIKQPFAHHKGFSRSAFLAGTTIEAQRARAAMLLQPGFGGDRRGECRRTEQIVPAAVAVGSRCRGCRFRAVGLLAEARQGVKFAEQGNDRLAFADAGDKGIRDPTRIASELETFCLQGVRQALGGPVLLKAGLRVIPDVIGDGAVRLASRLNHLVHKLKNGFHYTPRCQGKLSAIRARVSTASAMTLSSKSNFSLW